MLAELAKAAREKRLNLMADFPTVTAAEVVLPIVDGNSGLTPKGEDLELPIAGSSQRVWVQTLSAYHRDEAQRTAKWNAAVTTQPIKKGGELYTAVRADYDMMEVDEQVNYLISYWIMSGEPFQEVDRKHKKPQSPVLDELDEVASVEATAKYEEECDKVGKARTDYIETLRKSKEKLYRDMYVVTRVDECMRVCTRQEFNSVYRVNITNEILHRAVRQADNHRVRAFTVEDLQEMDDEPKQKLADKYAEVDNLTGEEVPT